jgi:hypothetical protein
MPYIRIFKNGQLIELRAENKTIGEIKNFLKKKLNNRYITLFSNEELDNNFIVESDITLELVEYQCLIDKLIYVDHILPTSDFNRVNYACGLLDSQLKLEKTDTVVRKIVSIPPPGTPWEKKENILYDVFYGEFFLSRLKKIVGLQLKPSTIPIDYRVYEIGGSMNWHRDTILSRDYPQIEIVFTLENNSDSTTEWLDDDTNEIHSIWTSPNSIVITQGGGVYHRVLPVKKGSRSIIKIAYNVV